MTEAAALDPPQLAPARGRRRRGLVLIGATLALWAHYGTAVFYEMIAAGIAMCF